MSLSGAYSTSRQHSSLADLNGQALAWCNKVNGRVHATTNEIPFERLKKEGLNPLSREYIIDKINLIRMARTSYEKRYEKRKAAVEYCIEHGKDYKATAARFGCTYQQIYGWVRTYHAGGLEKLCNTHNFAGPRMA